MTQPKKPRKSRAKVLKPGEIANVGGRPTKATDEDKLRLIVQTLSIGTHLDVACYVAELNPRTVRSYMEEARANPDSVYGEWSQKITAAMSSAEVRDLAVIDTAAKGRPTQYAMEPALDSKGDPIYDNQGNPKMKVQLDGEGKPIVLRREVSPQWQAAAWKLERSKPKRWGRYDRIAVDDLEAFGKDPRNKTEEQKIDDGEKEARLARLVRVKAVLESVGEDTDLGEVDA